MKLKTKKEIDEILQIIWEIFPDARTELNYKTDFELLIAVMLSAQTTDNQVNIVTKELFKKIKKPEDIANFSQKELEKMINKVNYHRNKAKFIVGIGEKLISEFNSKVPQDIENLIKLPWVWIKTAKVLLGVLYDMPFVAVDTHVHRVCNRIWFVTTKLPEETDKKLEKILTHEQKIKMHHITVLFGRYICTARNPKCSECKVKNYCNFYNKNS